MNRRDFLKTVGVGAAGCAVAPFLRWKKREPVADPLPFARPAPGYEQAAFDRADEYLMASIFNDGFTVTQ